MFPNISLSFITNIVKGLQSYKNRLKLIQYFKGKIGSTGVSFWQETHSSSKVEQKWKEDFKGHVFFSYGKINSWVVLTAYFGKKTFAVKTQETDNEGHALILDVSVHGSEYILTNFCNTKTEKEQINVFSNMFSLLEVFDINPKKQINMVGDFNLFVGSKLDAQGGRISLQLNVLNLMTYEIYGE